MKKRFSFVGMLILGLSIIFGCAGAKWRGIEKDTVGDDGTINVNNKNRVPTSTYIKRDANDVIICVTRESLGISPKSNLDYLKIGVNESRLLQHYLNNRVINRFYFPRDLKEYILSLELERGKELATKEIQTWGLSLKLKEQLVREIEQINTPAKLKTFLDKGLEYKIKSWAEYKANGNKVPEVKVNFGEAIGREHYIQWRVGIVGEFKMIVTLLDSGNSPLVGQHSIKEKDKNVPLQVWGGKFPILTRMSFNEEGEFNFQVIESNQRQGKLKTNKKTGKEKRKQVISGA